METLLLNKSQVLSLLDRDEILKAVESGYKSFNSGLVVQPDFMSIVRPGTHVGFDIKGGMDLGGGYISLKSSSGGYQDNPSKGLPTGMNMVYLYEEETSFLKCIMDGTWITGCRTAAAGAISVKYLARKNATKLAVMGSGNQARRQLEAIVRVRDIKEVYVYSYTPEHTADYIEQMKKEFPDIRFVNCPTSKEAVMNADIIVTTTRGRKGPLFQKEWVKPGTHIAAIGSDMPDKQELPVDLFINAKVVCDSKQLCVKNGETHHAVEEGIITLDEVYAEIGEILLGQKAGRESEEEITIFDTVGMAIQDNVMAGMLYELAVKKGLGTYYDFMK